MDDDVGMAESRWDFNAQSDYGKPRRTSLVLDSSHGRNLTGAPKLPSKASSKVDLFLIPLNFIAGRGYSFAQYFRACCLGSETPCLLPLLLRTSSPGPG